MRSLDRIPLLRPGDLVLVAGVVILALLVADGGRDAGDNAVAIINCDGHEIMVPLDRDTTMWIEGRMGTLTLEIEQGRVRIASSPCPGQDCVRRGWISSAGDATICIPSAVMVRIDSPEQSDSIIDAVSY